MPTFLDITNDLMDTINRPTSETQVLARAKRSINSAITWLQRHHAFRFTDSLIRFTYPANALQINLSTVCDGLLRDIVSTQLIGTLESVSGQPLPYTTYTQLQVARMRYQALHTHANEWEYLTDIFGHHDYTRLVHRHYVFRLGQNLGLYPVPQADTYLLMHAHRWLPLLVADGDTNFFLDYGYDVVLALALKYMHIYMKEDDRVMVSVEDMQTAFATLIALDAQVHESNVTSLT